MTSLRIAALALCLFLMPVGCSSVEELETDEVWELETIVIAPYGCREWHERDAEADC